MSHWITFLLICMRAVSKLLFIGSMILNLYFLIRKMASTSGAGIGVPGDDEEEVFQKGKPVKKPADATPATSRKESNLININRASFEDLVTLNGIGEDLASKILEDREANGPFSDVGDLTRVTGLGEKKLDMFRDVIGTEDR